MISNDKSEFSIHSGMTEKFHGAGARAAHMHRRTEPTAVIAADVLTTQYRLCGIEGGRHDPAGHGPR